MEGTRATDSPRRHSGGDNAGHGPHGRSSLGPGQSSIPDRGWYQGAGEPPRPELGDDSRSRRRHRKATEVAIRWGVELGRIDKQADRKRGELWATAFPTSDSASSRRYASQFLGTLSTQGPLGGADILGLVAFSGPEDDPRVTLTQAGAQWASLENPVFDTAHPKSTFSVLETRFFLEHLERHLPDEYEFLQLVTELIDRGLDRTTLDKELEKSYPMWAGYVETMRAGAIGRLHDLGLLHRIQKGREG